MNLEEGNLEWDRSQSREGLGLGLRGIVEGTRGSKGHLRLDRWPEPQVGGRHSAR